MPSNHQRWPEPWCLGATRCPPYLLSVRFAGRFVSYSPRHALHPHRRTQRKLFLVNPMVYYPQLGKCGQIHDEVDDVNCNQIRLLLIRWKRTGHLPPTMQRSQKTQEQNKQYWKNWNKNLDRSTLTINTFNSGGGTNLSYLNRSKRSTTDLTWTKEHPQSRPVEAILNYYDKIHLMMNSL